MIDASDMCEDIVGGRVLETTINVFLLKAAVILRLEQRRAHPDNHLISFVCDAVRLAREHCDAMKRGISAQPESRDG